MKGKGAVAVLTIQRTMMIAFAKYMLDERSNF
jgi:hypothetical protein